MGKTGILTNSIYIFISYVIWVALIPIWKLKGWVILPGMIVPWVYLEVIIIAMLAFQCYSIYWKLKVTRNFSHFAFWFLILDFGLNLVVLFFGKIIEFGGYAGVFAALISLTWISFLFIFYISLEKETREW